MPKVKEVTNRQIIKGIEKLHTKFHGVDNEFEIIHKEFKKVHSRFDVVDVRLAAHDEKHVEHDTKLDRITNLLDQIIKVTTDTNQELVAHNALWRIHDNRMTETEKSIKTINKKVATA